MLRAILTLITRCFTRDETSLKKGAEKSKMPKDEETISIIFYSMIKKNPESNCSLKLKLSFMFQKKSCNDLCTFMRGFCMFFSCTPTHTIQHWWEEDNKICLNFTSFFPSLDWRKCSYPKFARLTILRFVYLTTI